MEGFPRQCFRHAFGLRAIAPEHDNACVVIFHRQAPIILRLFHLPHVFARFDAAEGQIAGVRDGIGRELLRVTGVTLAGLGTGRGGGMGRRVSDRFGRGWTPAAPWGRYGTDRIT